MKQSPVSFPSEEITSMGAVTSRPSLVIKNQAGIFKVARLTSLLYVNPVVGLFNYGTDRL